MAAINYIFAVSLFILLPLLVMWLCRRVTLLSKIGPIMVLYAIGIAIGNIPNLPAEMGTVQKILPDVMIPLAIPMMLYGCNFAFSETRLLAKVVISGFLSVAIAVTAGYLLIGHDVAEGAKIGGIISSMYTGGTLNAASLQTILKAEEETFVLINSYDIVVSFLYFVFLFSVGIRLFRWLYGEPTTRTHLQDGNNTTEESVNISNPYSGLWSKQGRKDLAKIIGVTLCIIAISAAVAIPFPGDWFTVVFILVLTTLGVAASFIKPVHKLKYSYDIGLYLIYIFSLVIATMADLSTFDLERGLHQVGFMAFAVFVSLMLHTIFCRLMRIDADSMVISSVSFINSPPFVPMAVAAMRNRSVLVVGLSAGIVGYAFGNHFGVLMAKLLETLG